MTAVHAALDFFLHVNRYLNAYAGDHSVGVYVLLTTIIFCETGLVVTPFLPGDSLLFAVGALAASAGSPINLPLLIVLLCAAANCGDIVNYMLGRRLGPAVFRRDGWLLSRKHLLEAQAFYDQHGRKTIVMARFVPIIRTFAPFVAGIGRMTFPRFIGFSVGGGALWVTLLTLAGYFFGTIAWVDKHFEVIVLAIVAISLLPMAFHAAGSRGRRGTAPVETAV